MNLFYLSIFIDECARFHCDKHVIKMILELAQMLYTTHHVLESNMLITCPHKPYRKTHFNHPTAKWVRDVTHNYIYTCQLGLLLCQEYTRRYKKIHATQKHLEWLLENIPLVIEGPMWHPPPAVDVECLVEGDVVASYRKYYREKKAYFAKWKIDQPPKWF